MLTPGETAKLNKLVRAKDRVKEARRAAQGFQKDIERDKERLAWTRRQPERDFKNKEAPKSAHVKTYQNYIEANNKNLDKAITRVNKREKELQDAYDDI